MAIATGTALALAAGASAGSGLWGAHKQSSAAKKAAEQQSQAATQAQNYYRQGIGQLGQMYAPYINSGMSTMNTLGRLTTPGPGARFASPGPPQGMPTMPQPPPQMRGGPFTSMAGPYAMAEGGDMMVNEPTLFLAGEAGPERATFQPQQSVAQGQWGGQPMADPRLAQMRQAQMRQAQMGQMGPAGPPPPGMQGIPPQGMPPPWMPPQGMPSQQMFGMPPPGMPPDLSRGMPGRAGALAGAMQGRQTAAPMNAMRGRGPAPRGPFARMF